MNARPLKEAAGISCSIAGETGLSSPYLSCLRILVFGDNSGNPPALLDSLRSLGISQITLAADMAANAPDRFDIVFFDLDDESMDGIEFIRRSAEFDNQALILMSAHDEDLLASIAAFARSHRVNMMGVLSKPVVRHELASLLAQYGVHNPGASHHDDGQAHIHWHQEDLARALDHRQFIPFFQPQFELATGHITSVEVLARWNHPKLGVLPPSQFIDVMEQTGLVDRLLETLLDQSLAHARQWDAGGFPIALAINVSPVTLQNSDLPYKVSEMVRQHDVQPERVTLEVTETAMAQDPDRLLETALRLRLRGFKLSVDDFGTGYSTLQQLSEMPFTEIKIDHKLVAGISGSKKSATILESIVWLANKLGMCTVAEGILSRRDHELIQSLGCRFGQAYYLARPMGNAELARRLACG